VCVSSPLLTVCVHISPVISRTCDDVYLLQACWVLNNFAELKFKNVNNLRTALDIMRNILSNDREVPVRIEAATALQQLLCEQEKGSFHALISFRFFGYILWMYKD